MIEAQQSSEEKKFADSHTPPEWMSVIHASVLSQLPDLVGFEKAFKPQGNDLPTEPHHIVANSIALWDQKERNPNLANEANGAIINNLDRVIPTHLINAGDEDKDREQALRQMDHHWKTYVAAAEVAIAVSLDLDKVSESQALEVLSILLRSRRVLSDIQNYHAENGIPWINHGPLIALQGRVEMAINRSLGHSIDERESAEIEAPDILHFVQLMEIVLSDSLLPSADREMIEKAHQKAKSMLEVKEGENPPLTISKFQFNQLLARLVPEKAETSDKEPENPVPEIMKKLAEAHKLIAVNTHKKVNEINWRIRLGKDPEYVRAQLVPTKDEDIKTLAYHIDPSQIGLERVSHTINGEADEFIKTKTPENFDTIAAYSPALYTDKRLAGLIDTLTELSQTEDGPKNVNRETRMRYLGKCLIESVKRQGVLNPQTFPDQLKTVITELNDPAFSVEAYNALGTFYFDQARREDRFHQIVHPNTSNWRRGIASLYEMMDSINEYRKSIIGKTHKAETSAFYEKAVNSAIATVEEFFDSQIPERKFDEMLDLLYESYELYTKMFFDHDTNKWRSKLDTLLIFHAKGKIPQLHIGTIAGNDGDELNKPYRQARARSLKHARSIDVIVNRINQDMPDDRPAFVLHAPFMTPKQIEKLKRRLEVKEVMSPKEGKFNLNARRTLASIYAADGDYEKAQEILITDVGKLAFMMEAQNPPDDRSQIIHKGMQVLARPIPEIAEDRHDGSHRPDIEVVKTALVIRIAMLEKDEKVRQALSHSVGKGTISEHYISDLADIYNLWRAAKADDPWFNEVRSHVHELVDRIGKDSLYALFALYNPSDDAYEYLLRKKLPIDIESCGEFLYPLCVATAKHISRDLKKRDRKSVWQRGQRVDQAQIHEKQDEKYRSILTRIDTLLMPHPNMLSKWNEMLKDPKHGINGLFQNNH